MELEKVKFQRKVSHLIQIAVKARKLDTGTLRSTPEQNQEGHHHFLKEEHSLKQEGLPL